MSQRKLLLPPFHGARMQGYEEKMTEIAAREIESWPLGTPHKLRPRMQAMTLEIILETVFGVHGGERMEELRVALREFLDLTTNPLLLAPLVLVGPDRVAADPGLPPPHRARRRAAPPRDRRAPGGRRRRGARRHPLAAGRRPPRGRQPDERGRDARRAAHPAGRRPRDDRHLALLGDGAPRPPPGEARAPARRGAGRRGRLPDGDDPGDAAPAPGDRARRQAADRAGRDRRLRAAGRGRR